MKKLILSFLWLSCVWSSWAQGSDLYGSGIKVKLNEDGSKYIRFINWNQVWTTAQEFNSGTQVLGKPQSEGFDIALRRSRMLMYAQISPKFLILTHFGINNQNITSFKPQLFIHDIWGEYQITKGKTKAGMPYELSFGAGLTYWNGISRLTNASTLNFMTLDAPIFNWPHVDAIDQFARMMSLYVKGKIEKLDYRVAISKPFAPRTGETINSAGVPIADVDFAISTASKFNPSAINLAFQGYFNYQFWEQESNLLPFMVGTYLGTKKVFNLGAGFYHRTNGMWHRNGTDTVFQNNTIFSLDAFLDYPINKEKGTALTAYAVWYNMNFGKDYVRNIGILNQATGANAIAGSRGISGNAMPTVGTGNSFHAQVGYLIEKNAIKGARLQPYAAASVHSFHGLKDASGNATTFIVPQAGINLLLEGHHSKITLDYKHRPDFNKYNALYNYDISYKPDFTIQYMVFL
ncbi:MAG: hypothetical protein MUE53_09135 [Chitinophagales bacterium]|jgi:hypothetical protein|nr:hypothetical protein [Chitinophagales bacterium]